MNPSTLLDCGHSSDKYGIIDNKKLCYACCGEHDKKMLTQESRYTLYLSGGFKEGFTVSNWPGTLTIKPTYVRRGRHNIAKSRYDVWFTFKGANWHGVQYGENTQLLHCKKLKLKVK